MKCEQKNMKKCGQITCEINLTISKCCKTMLYDINLYFVELLRIHLCNFCLNKDKMLN